jgi:putative membrane protein
MRLLHLRLCMLVVSAGFAPAATAHVGNSTADAPLILTGNVDAWIAMNIAILSCLYAAGMVRLRREAPRSPGIPVWQAACFSAGLAVLSIALLSPLDTLSEELFFMHMVQHELLMLAAAPLLVAGRPLAVFIWAFRTAWRRRIARLLKAGVIQRIGRALTRPLVAWSLQALMVWIWHVPRLFQASLSDDAVHTAQHLGFLLSALLFWSSLIGPYSRLRYGGAVLSVLCTAIHTGVLGALLTFSPRAWYPVYAGSTEEWGMTLLEDQQLGGLIMWVPAGFVFVFAGLAFAAKAIAPQRDISPQAISEPVQA